MWRAVFDVTWHKQSPSSSAGNTVLALSISTDEENLDAGSFYILSTYILSVSAGIFRGTCVSPRWEQSTVLPVQEQDLGHFTSALLPTASALSAIRLSTQLSSIFIAIISSATAMRRYHHNLKQTVWLFFAYKSFVLLLGVNCKV